MVINQILTTGQGVHILTFVLTVGVECDMVNSGLSEEPTKKKKKKKVEPEEVNSVKESESVGETKKKKKKKNAEANKKRKALDSVEAATGN